MSTEHPTSFWFVASTGDPDRNGNVMDADGWDLANYKANPVVLFNHNWDLPPVGRATDIHIEALRLLARVEFAPTSLGQELALLNADGYMKAISVGARPLQWEVRRHPDHGFPIGIHSHRQELLELSVVAIPANPATVQALRAGAQMPDLLPDAILSYLRNPHPAQFPGPADQEAANARDRAQAILQSLEAIQTSLRLPQRPLRS